MQLFFFRGNRICSTADPMIVNEFSKFSKVKTKRKRLTWAKFFLPQNIPCASPELYKLVKSQLGTMCRSAKTKDSTSRSCVRLLLAAHKAQDTETGGHSQVRRQDTANPGWTGTTAATTAAASGSGQSVVV